MTARDRRAAAAVDAALAAAAADGGAEAAGVRHVGNATLALFFEALLRAESGDPVDGGDADADASPPPSQRPRGGAFAAGARGGWPRTLRRALASVRAVERRLHDAKGLLSLQGVGPTVVALVTSHLWTRAPPPPPAADDLLADAEAAVAARCARAAAATRGPPPLEAPADAPPPPPGRPYRPAVGSAAYAFLVTLHQLTVIENTPFATKSALLAATEASGLADKPVTGAGVAPAGWPGSRGRSHYSAGGWASFRALTTRAPPLAAAWSAPLRVALTAAGAEVAVVLRADAVARGTLPPGRRVDGDGAATPAVAARAVAAAAPLPRRSPRLSSGGGGGRPATSSPGGVVVLSTDDDASPHVAARRPRKQRRSGSRLHASSGGGGRPSTASVVLVLSDDDDGGGGGRDAAPAFVPLTRPAAPHAPAISPTAPLIDRLGFVPLQRSNLTPANARGPPLVAAAPRARCVSRPPPPLPPPPRRRAAARAAPLPAPTAALPPPPTLNPWALPTACSGAAPSTTRVPPLPPGSSTFADAYDVVLVLDDREHFGTRAGGGGGARCDAALAALAAAGARVEARQLPGGDALWLARPKGGDADTAYVLDFVVERKRCDDLIGSLRSGRLAKQVSALRASGATTIALLIEGDARDLPSDPARAHKTVVSAAHSAVVHDGLVTLRSASAADTWRLYARLTRELAALYGPMRQGDGAAGQGPPPTFTEFSDAVSRARAARTARDAFALMLAAADGVGPDTAAALAAVYGTPGEFWRALKAAAVGAATPADALAAAAATLADVPLRSRVRRVGGVAATALVDALTDGGAALLV